MEFSGKLLNLPRVLALHLGYQGVTIPRHRSVRADKIAQLGDHRRHVRSAYVVAAFVALLPRILIMSLHCRSGSRAYGRQR